MRLRAIPPSDLTGEQRELYDEMKPEVDAKLSGPTSQTDSGALIGPFPPMLHWPAWGRGVWAQVKSLLDHTVLPKPAHEVAILVTGAGYRVQYELYAHERIASDRGLSGNKIAAIVAGQRPPDLTLEEAAAYDLAAALQRGAAVPDATYDQAVAAFGDEGAAELIFLVAGYSSVSVLLNGFAMPTPDGDA